MDIQHIGENYPPHELFSQVEFDRMMNELRQQHTDEAAPLRLQMEELTSRKREIGYEIAALNAQLNDINTKRQTVRERLKEIGAKYHYLKNKLIRENPKVAPPTAQAAYAEATCS